MKKTITFILFANVALFFAVSTISANPVLINRDGPVSITAPSAKPNVDPFASLKTALINNCTKNSADPDGDCSYILNYEGYFTRFCEDGENGCYKSDFGDFFYKDIKGDLVLTVDIFDNVYEKVARVRQIDFGADDENVSELHCINLLTRSNFFLGIRTLPEPPCNYDDFKNCKTSPTMTLSADVQTDPNNEKVLIVTFHEELGDFPPYDLAGILKTIRFVYTPMDPSSAIEYGKKENGMIVDPMFAMPGPRYRDKDTHMHGTWKQP
jgi:hypothetical protein